MSDIHILEGNLKEFQQEIKTGTFQIAYHIPIDNPNSSLTFPNFSSIVPNIESNELTNLRNGLGLEIFQTINYNDITPNLEYINYLKNNWSSLRKVENIKYDFRTKFYLTELNI